MKKSSLLHPAIACAMLCCFLAPVARAQSPAANEANIKAYDLYMQGNYEEAAAAYAQLIKDYPTDILVSTARTQLGFAQFFLGKFDESLKTLEDTLKDPALPQELKPVIASFIPQVLSAKAAALPDGDAKRTTAFEQAIAKFDEYLKTYPQGDQAEQVRYGKALALYQLSKFPEAAAVLEENVQKHPNSPSIQESENLLALAYATMGSIELTKPGGGDTAKGFEMYSKAEKLLRGIIDSKKNLTLVNDARYQLAEILFSKAAFSPEAQRPALYQEALAAYRTVAPNEEMIAMQQEKLAGLPARRQEVLRTRNQNAIKEIDREIEREQRRLGELKAKPDIIPTAGLKMAEIYFNQGKINESRVAIRHMLPFLTRDDDKMRAQYFLTMTYILQNVASAAQENYDKFQAENKGNAIAQNLPLALGNMYLSHPDPSVRSVEKAIQYFDESLAVYPKGALAGLTVVSKASAQTKMGQLPEAEATFTKFLSGSPSPDEEIVALMGLADIQKLNKQWEKANETYAKVIGKHSSRPQAVEAQFWIALGTKEKGDNAAAIDLLNKAIAAHPEHPMVPTAMFYLARAKLDSGDVPAAMQTFAELAEKYPDSQTAPFTYFARMQVLARERKMDEITALMREFITKYPQDDKVFFAYEQIAQIAYSSAKWEDAINTYGEFVEKYGEHPKAPSALLKQSEFQKQWAESLGRYGALTTDERKVWQERMDMAVASGERMVKQYPQSPEIALGVQNLIGAQNALVAAELKSREDIESYFKQLAEGAPDDATRSKILFGLASWLAATDEARALATMGEAYQETVVYAPNDLDTYGTALLKAGKVEDAEKVFAKLERDYPTPAGVDPKAAPPQIQQAQAVALFGKARVAQERELTSEAGTLFARLKALYPWSPKVLEAELGIAEANFSAGKLDDAISRLPGVIRAPNATAELRAKAMLLGGRVMKQKAATATDPKAKEEATGAAVDYFIKIDQFYSGVPSIAAEGLYEGAQMLEAQAAASSDATFKKRQTDLAKRSYSDLVKKYPESPFAAKASQRLSALGG